MHVTEQQRKGWLFTCTEQQRLAVFGVMHDWAREIGENDWLLDPCSSREKYRLFANSLADLVRKQHGVDFAVDPDLQRQWGRLGPSAQARWVSAAGHWLERESLGWRAAETIRYSLEPPSFRSQTVGQQQNLLAQIAGEAERYLDLDPHWYGRAATPVYERLVWSIRAVERPVDWLQPPSPVVWSHVNRPQRGQILADIAKCARMDAQRPQFPDDVRRNLTGLATAADWIAGLHRPKGLARE